MRLANKIAVITGAGSGMGKAMAELFAVEGAQVVCADISGQQNDVAAAIGAAAIAVHADVADEASVRGMITAAEQKFGRLDILVNNAGFGGKMAPLHEQTAEVLKTLSAREEKIIRLRFGLEDGSEHTLEEVGQNFAVTRERIRQIEAKALRKLRHPSRSYRLKTFLEEV